MSNFGQFISNGVSMTRRTFVITATNHKGGCGKTTTIVNLAAELANLGRSVIVIDLDPQGNTSSHISPITPSELKITISDLLIDGNSDKLIHSIQEETNIPGVSLIAATQSLLVLAEENRLSTIHKTNRPHEILSRVISPLDGIYDYILIDTGPNLGVLTGNALEASTHYITPVKSGSVYSIEGLAGLPAFIDNIKKSNLDLQPLGVLFTDYNERQKADRLAKAVIGDLQKDKLPIIPIEIISSTNVDFAALNKTSLSQLDKNSPVAKSFMRLAMWVDKKLNS